MASSGMSWPKAAQPDLGMDMVAEEDTEAGERLLSQPPGGGSPVNARLSFGFGSAQQGGSFGRLTGIAALVGLLCFVGLAPVMLGRGNTTEPQPRRSFGERSHQEHLLILTDAGEAATTTVATHPGTPAPATASPTSIPPSNATEVTPNTTAATNATAAPPPAPSTPVVVPAPAAPAQAPTNAAPATVAPANHVATVAAASAPARERPATVAINASKGRANGTKGRADTTEGTVGKATLVPAVSAVALPPGSALPSTILPWPGIKPANSTLLSGVATVPTTSSVVPIIRRSTSTTHHPTVTEVEDSPCYRRYHGGKSHLWKGLCQCQVSGNIGCMDTPCRCPESCHGKVWRHPASVTYTETAKAFGCAGPSSVLVTIPKSYFRDLADLKKECPHGTVPLLREMLRKSYETYQEQVSPGVVQQCIHAAPRTHSHWLTLHTLCGEGQVDHMPSNYNIAWCATMATADEADSLAEVLATWAGIHLHEKRPPDTCARMGCGKNDAKYECGCDHDCKARGDCCDDYEAVCQSALTVPDKCELQYKAGHNKAADCFCQRAGNKGCAKIASQCLCNHGCDGPVWQHSASVTFPNVVDAWGCGHGHPGTALLTIPRSYFRNIDELRTSCPSAASSLLASMLRAGFETYQQQVGPGVVRQCVHSGFAVSVRWLHVHTFCPEGTVDGMPLRNDIAWCGTMSTANDAEDLAEVVLAWSSASDSDSDD